MANHQGYHDGTCEYTAYVSFFPYVFTVVFYFYICEPSIACKVEDAAFVKRKILHWRYD